MREVTLANRAADHRRCGKHSVAVGLGRPRRIERILVGDARVILRNDVGFPRQTERIFERGLDASSLLALPEALSM